MRIPNKKQLYIISALCLAFLVAGMGLGYALTPSTTFTISSGVYPGSPSYTIYPLAGTYYAKDQNGYIEFSDANPTTVWQSVLNAMTNGGWIHASQGTYSSIGSLSIPYAKTFFIEGDGYWLTTLSFSGNGFVQAVGVQSPKIIFKDLAIVKAGAIGSIGINITGADKATNYAQVEVRGCYIYNWNVGIQLTYTRDSTIADTEVRGCMTGVSFLGGVELKIGDHTLIWGVATVGSKGVATGVAGADFSEGLTIDDDSTVGGCETAVYLSHCAGGYIGGMIDNWKYIGINVLDTSQDLTLSPHWCKVTSANFSGSRGINFAQGSVDFDSRVTITGVSSINAETCINFYQGSNVTITGNSMHGTYGVVCNANINIIVIGNLIEATTNSVTGSGGGYRGVICNRLWGATSGLTEVGDNVTSNIY